MTEPRTPKIVTAKKPGKFLVRYAEADLPTQRGIFRTIVFRDKRTGNEHLALVSGEVEGRESVPVRVHSECLTGEVFGSLKCDCRQQLERAMEYISRAGHGVILYLRQEGRGIGLGNKIKAYALQASGVDTYEANRRLGFPDDLRTYDVAAEILRMLGVLSVDLMTNNPLKIAGLVDEGIPVRRRIPSRTAHNPHNADYLKAKRDRSGHLIETASDEEAKAS
ncbi:MAG TPA: GTP cyclohydrolase II [Myxococcaceae bacterium]|nr:GTP cyclohydrolase II [Myxococcaceae bacterium]